jgi:DNA-binding GntR family transcriptional regulator
MTLDHQPPIKPLADGASSDATSKTSLMYHQIVSSIVEHRISPGTRFREERLATLFDVSRTQVRKVLQRLELEGLVVRQPRKGVSVAAPSLEETRDIFEARRLIEPWIVGKLCEHCSRAQVLGLRKIVREENNAHLKGERHLAIRLSGEFHRALANALANRALIKTMEELTVRTCLAILANKASTQATCRDDEHLKIVEAIENKDHKLSARLMLSHLKHIEESLQMPALLESTDNLDILLQGITSDKHQSLRIKK